MQRSMACIADRAVRVCMNQLWLRRGCSTGTKGEGQRAKSKRRRARPKHVKPTDGLSAWLGFCLKLCFPQQNHNLAVCKSALTELRVECARFAEDKFRPAGDNFPQ